MLDAPSQITELHQIAIHDLLACLKVEQLPPARWLLSGLCWPMARRFARCVATYDRIVGEAGLRAGSDWVFGRFAGGLRVRGREHVPRSSPLLIVSNHPGLTDGPALCASLPRSDLRVVAAGHKLFRMLPNTSRYLIYVSEDSRERLPVVREVVRHLRAGGAVLIFPRGGMEPDPAMMQGAIEHLEGWSESIALFVRRVPEASVVPVVVRGVRAPATLRHPLTRLYRQQPDRERVAAVLQVLFARYQKVTVEVVYGSPLPAAHLAALTDSAAITRAVIAQMARLLAS